MKARQIPLFDVGPNPSDVVYTPESLAYDIVSWLQPSGLCLDPCLGDGVFYKFLPENSDWCEIEKGKDFFKYNKRIDWIIGNPPI